MSYREFQYTRVMRSFDLADAGVPGQFCLFLATLATAAEAIAEDTRKLFRKLV